MKTIEEPKDDVFERYEARFGEPPALFDHPASKWLDLMEEAIRTGVLSLFDVGSGIG